MLQGVTRCSAQTHYSHLRPFSAASEEQCKGLPERERERERERDRESGNREMQRLRQMVAAEMTCLTIEEKYTRE